jgi:hypothetical protein
MSAALTFYLEPVDPEDARGDRGRAGCVSRTHRLFFAARCASIQCVAERTAQRLRESAGGLSLQKI